MMQYLKADTEITIRIGPFLDNVDGKSAETGLTITQPNIRLSKNGGDFAQKAAAETLVHDENGWYILTLDATDTNTEGRLDVAIHVSGALPVWREFMVANANWYDSQFAAATTDYLDVNVLTQTNIDFGALQKASLETAVENKLTAANVELAAVPASTGGLRSMIQFVFEKMRHKGTLNKDTGLETLYKDDGSTPLGTATDSDDGTTVTRGEMS